MSRYRSDASLYFVVVAYGAFTIVGGVFWFIACLRNWLPWWTFLWWCSSFVALSTLGLYLILSSVDRRSK